MTTLHTRLTEELFLLSGAASVTFTGESFDRLRGLLGEAADCVAPHDDAIGSGRDRLWSWFGMSYASWLTMPRVMMHAMPDDLQYRMAALCEEWDAAWNSDEMPTPHVTAKRGNRFAKWPDWLLNYRHPDRDEIDKLRVPVGGGEGDGRG